MDDGQHRDPFAIGPVNQAMALHDQLADVLAAGFRRHPALAREQCQRLRPLEARRDEPPPRSR